MRLASLAQFSPHNNTNIVTATNDGTIATNNFAKGTMEEVNSAATGLAVTSLALHPSAEHTAAVSDSHKVSVFDLKSGSPLPICSTKPTSIINSFNFNCDGSAVLVTSMDKFLRVVDPRNPRGSPLAVLCHKSNKNMHAVHCGASFRNNLLTVGQSMMRERECCLWDIRSLASPVQRERLDASSGDLVPHFDADANLLYLVGKGELGVRIYELSGEKVCLIFLWRRVWPIAINPHCYCYYYCLAPPHIECNVRGAASEERLLRSKEGPGRDGEPPRSWSDAENERNVSFVPGQFFCPAERQDLQRRAVPPLPDLFPGHDCGRVGGGVGQISSAW